MTSTNSCIAQQENTKFVCSCKSGTPRRSDCGLSQLSATLKAVYLSDTGRPREQDPHDSIPQDFDESYRVIALKIREIKGLEELHIEEKFCGALTPLFDGLASGTTPFQVLALCIELGSTFADSDYRLLAFNSMSRAIPVIAVPEKLELQFPISSTFFERRLVPLLGEASPYLSSITPILPWKHDLP